jgi:tryptophan-rich sensory protein
LRALAIGAKRALYSAMKRGKEQYRPLLGFLLATLAVGAAASLVTGPNVASWYAGLAKPSFNPPDWIFAPVWTVLYVMMAVAAWRVWRITGFHHGAIELYAAQLALNFTWSIVFFGLHAIAPALVNIVLLLILIVATAFSFWRQDRIAGLLFVPYIAWVAFAGILNGAFFLANR